MRDNGKHHLTGARVGRLDNPGTGHPEAEMQRRRTGDTWLERLVPQGTEIAHKTGTIGGSTNDVGIIGLPDNAGHLAIAVFTKSSDKDGTARDRGITEIARAVYDFFLFQPRASS